MSAQAVLAGVVAERPKKTSSGRVYPAVDIPPELVAIGIDVEEFAAAVDCRPEKRWQAWRRELRALAPLVAECGGDVVREVWDESASAGYRGCMPSWVRKAARAAQRTPPSTYGRMNQGDDIAERARRRNGGGS